MKLLSGGLAAVAIVMVLVPPFCAEIGAGAKVNRGYHFLFSPPTLSAEHTAALATVDVPLLLVQLLALALVALLLLKSNRS